MKKYSIVLCAFYSLMSFGMNSDDVAARSKAGLTLSRCLTDILEAKNSVVMLQHAARESGGAIIQASLRVKNFAYMDMMLKAASPEQRGQLLLAIVRQEGESFGKIPSDEIPVLIHRFQPYPICPKLLLAAKEEEENSTGDLDTLFALDALSCDEKQFIAVLRKDPNILFKEKAARALGLRYSSVQSNNKENRLRGKNVSHEHMRRWDQQVNKINAQMLPGFNQSSFDNTNTTNLLCNTKK